MDTLIEAVQNLSLARDLTSTQKEVSKAALKLVGADIAGLVVNDNAFRCSATQTISRFEPIIQTVANVLKANWNPIDPLLLTVHDLQAGDALMRELSAASGIQTIAFFSLGEKHPNCVIELYWNSHYVLTKTQRDLLQLLASAACSNIDNITLLNELNNKVLERTASLYEAQQEAESANNFKTRFLSAASHDLRQPLQYLNTQCAILKRLSPSNEQLNHIGKMRSTISGMSRLLDALLNLDQLESGQLVPELQSLDLNDLLSEMRDEFSDIAISKELNLNVCALDVDIYSDPRLIRQMLRNLISNALKYTQRGSVEVTCEASEGMVSVVITDTGPGIPEDRQSDIFEPFFRLVQHRAQEGGFGLGLAVVKSLAEVLKHPISLYSGSESGSQFTIELPRSAKVSKALDITLNDAVQIENENTPTILYLEDDQDILEAVQTLLDMEGYKVLSAEASDEASLLIKDIETLPDLIITDNRLANGDNGLEVVSRLRAELNKPIPAIMLTGYTEKSLHEQALQIVQKVLCKPVDADVLIAEVRNFA